MPSTAIPTTRPSISLIFVILGIIVFLGFIGVMASETYTTGKTTPATSMKQKINGDSLYYNNHIIGFTHTPVQCQFNTPDENTGYVERDNGGLHLLNANPITELPNTRF
jgi:hypothetical protein